MRTINLSGRIINIDQIHYIRRESPKELLISFGSDFLRFTGTESYINDLFLKLERRIDEEFSCNG